MNLYHLIILNIKIKTKLRNEDYDEDCNEMDSLDLEELKGLS